MAQHHAARLPRASGRVLDERDVFRPDRREGGGTVVHLEVERLHDVTHVAGRRLGLLDSGPEPADGRHHLALGVAQDIGRRVHAEGGVEGHRHRAQPEGAEEGVEELGAGGVDEADLVAALHPELREPRGVARALLPQPAVGHRLIVEVEVRLTGFLGRPAPQELGQGGGHWGRSSQGFIPPEGNSTGAGFTAGILSKGAPPRKPLCRAAAQDPHAQDTAGRGDAHQVVPGDLQTLSSLSEKRSSGRSRSGRRSRRSRSPRPCRARPPARAPASRRRPCPSSGSRGRRAP